MFRFDDDLLANHHLLGVPANHSPVLHVRRLVGGRLFDHHIKSFDRVWQGASDRSARHFLTAVDEEF